LGSVYLLPAELSPSASRPKFFALLLYLFIKRWRAWVARGTCTK
jgi:hypothetical protein